ncbi:hypothetical protein AN216_23270 [Streptomyces oceani]|uniref:Uncharacterized protein n=1 Tax=Streptomyces oceani TaxID=1075402 RepID=A0A1E7JWA0_9ACTN|nr:hypothetical protein AN216_23270 [Streptomyces oceani]
MDEAPHDGDHEGAGEAPHEGAGQETTAFRDNRQRVGQGLALMGGARDIINVFAADPLEEELSDRVRKPRLREGLYPADEVRSRLHGFVPPPSHDRCVRALASRILVLRAAPGTGAGTSAFALLAEKAGGGRVTGLDSQQDLSAWRPKRTGGYLLQGPPRSTAEQLSDVLLTGLAELLRDAGAHLVITLAKEIRLPAETVRWQVTHVPPSAREVAAGRLRGMAEAGRLDEAQLSRAFRQLDAPDFADHLRTHPLPGDAVDLASGLYDSAVTGEPAASVLDGLRAGSPAAARTALGQARHSADDLSLLAAVALLPGQDRTVIEQFAALLRPLLSARATGPGEPGVAAAAERDVLGPAFEDRLEAVGARLLPAYGATTGRYRYRVRPVVFSGRHRAETLLRQLWLDYEGVPDLLWQALDGLPYQPGVELAAGESVGRVLAHATGPRALRQLAPFAASEKRWRRRLVAVALGELVQHPPVAGAVRELLRQWSRYPSGPVRCTVAETCAGSYGLARPEAALRLLDTVLEGAEPELERGLRAAVSFALSTLLSEEAHHPAVLERVADWLAAGPGTSRQAMAGHVLGAMSTATFPPPGRPGASRTTLAQVLVAHPRQALELVVLALDTAATHEAMAEGLRLLEDDRAGSGPGPGPGHPGASFDQFLWALSRSARDHRGVARYLLRRHRRHHSTQGHATPGRASS